MFSYLPPVVSGIATHTLYVARELIKRGHEIHIISFNTKNKGEYIHEGIHVHGFPSYINIVDMYALDAVFYLGEVIKILKKINPDIIHFHHRTSNIEFSMGEIKKKIDVPVVNTIHSATGALDTLDFRDLVHFIHYASLSLVLREHSDLVISVSDFNKKALVKNGVPEQKVRIIRNGVSPNQLKKVNKEQLRKKLKISEKSFVALFVGRHCAEKGLDYLIRAFNSMKKEDYKLVVMGEYPSTPLYKTLAAGNKNIIFTGFLSEKTRDDYYRASDVFILPSVYHEPQATVLFEAMAAKIPIIATSTGGTTELIKECKCGIFVKPRSVKELREAVLKLSSDKKLQEKFVKNGWEAITTKYTWPKIVDELEQAYKRVILKKK